MSKKDQAWWAATSWETDDDGWPMVMDDAGDMVRMPAPCPVGTRLWVREGLIRPDGDPWCYRADNQVVMVSKSDETAMLTWAHHKQQEYCPSMFMPRWASRIALEVMEARFQPLQNITEEDAKAEGAQPWPHDPQQRMTSGELGIEQPYRGGFACLWDDINEDRATWLSNPHLWAYSLKRLK
jgi:hypothetical protein